MKFWTTTISLTDYTLRISGKLGMNTATSGVHGGNAIWHGNAMTNLTAYASTATTS